MNNEQLKEMVDAGLSTWDIAKKTGMGQTTIRYWLKKNSLITNHIRRKLFNPEKEHLESIVADSITYAQILKRLGRVVHSTQYKWLKRKVAEYNIDTSHLKGLGHGTSVQKRKYSTDQLRENSELATGRVKKIILREELIEYKCKECNIGPEWQGKPMVLILDHINGVGNDHRLENLRFLCPNCNSQTDTFCGKNRKGY